LSEAVLDLALIDEERILALSPEAVSLYRWARDGLQLESRLLLPGVAVPVRTPGGLLTPPDEGGGFWALTSRLPLATLYRIEGRSLVEVAQADALPWPGCAEGLRFRDGTNVLQGRVASLGPGPYLTVEPGFGVAADGRLLEAETEAGENAPRVGPTLAALGRNWLAASQPAAPGARDAILLLHRDATGWRLEESLPVEGAVRALAARPLQERWRLVAAVEEAERSTHLLVLDLATTAP
jgi:hypothetical protein